MKRFCFAVSGIVFAALIIATLNRELTLVRTGTMTECYPYPYYGVMLTELIVAPAIPGNDFSQVYASSASLRQGGSAYHPKNWSGGRSAYPPFTHWLYVPVSRFSFDVAVLIQHAVSILGLAGATIFVLWQTGLGRHIWRVGMVQMALYFLTPIGMSHLERGQFDLLVATSALLCFGCIFLPGNRFGAAFLSGFLGAIKWTAPVFLGGLSLLGFLLGVGKKRWVFVLIPLVTVAVTLGFWNELREYWPSIRIWELEIRPTGLTLQHFLPRTLARALPLLVPVLLATVILIRKRTREVRARVFLSISFPTAVTLLILALCFGRQSYEYRTVALLAMVPALVVWVEREPCVSHWLKAFTALCFALLLPVTFRVFGFIRLFDSVVMTKVYALFALLFFLDALYIASSKPT